MQRFREDESVAESAKMRHGARRAMGARMYMPEIGRFLSVDPLAEAFPTQSPYNFALNNPINFRDPSGLAPEKEKGDMLLGTAAGTLTQDLEEWNRAASSSSQSTIAALAMSVMDAGERDVLLGPAIDIDCGDVTRVGWSCEMAEYFNKQTMYDLIDKINENTANGVSTGRIDFSDCSKEVKEKLLKDIKDLTGLVFEVDKTTNLLVYKGISGEEWSGSSAAAIGVLEVLANPLTDIKVTSIAKKGAGAAPDNRNSYYSFTINLDPSTIESFMKNCGDLNASTVGYAITFVHELQHTPTSFFRQTGHEGTDNILPFENLVRVQMGPAYGIKKQFQTRTGINPSDTSTYFLFEYNGEEKTIRGNLYWDEDQWKRK